MSYGYAGKIVEVDLTSQKIQRTSTKQYFDVELLIGGKGLGSLVLWGELKPNTDPFSPENILVFSTGPLTGTMCPSVRMCLPKRILTEPLPSEIAKGQKLTQAQLNQMLDEYYKLRGWNIRTGTPSKEKLGELELDFVNL